MHVAGPVGGQNRHRRHRGAHRAQLGDGDRPVGQHLQQEGLELVVGAVDLVDEEDGRNLLRRPGEGLEQRAADEEPLVVELRLQRVDALGASRHVGGLGGPEVQELAGVVPLVEGLGGVDPLVALEPHQRGPGPRRECFRHLGLADPGVALEEERALQPEGEEDDRRQALVGQVPLVAQPLDDLVDAIGPRRARRDARCHALPPGRARPSCPVIGTAARPRRIGPGAGACRQSVVTPGTATGEGARWPCRP